MPESVFRTDPKRTYTRTRVFGAETVRRDQNRFRDTVLDGDVRERFVYVFGGLFAVLGLLQAKQPLDFPSTYATLIRSSTEIRRVKTLED